VIKTKRTTRQNTIKETKVSGKEGVEEGRDQHSYPNEGLYHWQAASCSHESHLVKAYALPFLHGVLSPLVLSSSGKICDSEVASPQTLSHLNTRSVWICPCVPKIVQPPPQKVYISTHEDWLSNRSMQLTFPKTCPRYAETFLTDSSLAAPQLHIRRTGEDTPRSLKP
jgi:hypothetical protein